MLSLITGANGFIGSHVTRFLIGQGEQVRVLVRPQSDRRLLEGLPVEFAYADLRDANSLLAPLRGVERVYHVAADYRLWAKNPQEIYESNVTGTRNLLAAARQAGIDRFIYTSSVGTLVPPHPRTLPDEETHLQLKDMIGHYKRSKFLAEQEAREAARQGQPVVIVNPYHPGGPGGLEAHPHGPHHSRLSQWQDTRIRRHRLELSLPLRMSPGGTGWLPSADRWGRDTFWATAI
jgi:dihydroflavonol-4-reductase